MRLHDLHAPVGANSSRKRLGRGESSGLGKTSGKGNKGQLARTGKGKPRRGFEGGQMPMFRRMPKRGFVHVADARVAHVNLDLLGSRFEAGSEVNLETLKKIGLIARNSRAVRILGRGDLAHALIVAADHFSASAKTKIESAGGKATLIAQGMVQGTAQA